MLKPPNEHKYANSVPQQLHCLSATGEDGPLHRMGPARSFVLVFSTVERHPRANQ